MSDDDLLTTADLVVDLGDTFRDVLHDNYSVLSPEETDRVLLDMFESLPPLEAFSLGKALADARKGASKALEDPALRQIAAAALPTIGTAAGTAFGGPVGGVVGTSFGQVAGQALAGAPKPSPPVPAPAAPAVAAAPVRAPATAALPAPAAAAGPAALTAPTAAAAAGPPGQTATQALIFSLLPATQRAALAAAMGPNGATTIGGVPVSAFLQQLGALFQQAASEAAEAEAAELVDDQALYEALVFEEDQDLRDLAGLL